MEENRTSGPGLLPIGDGPLEYAIWPNDRVDDMPPRGV
jgi:hypothetical protein